ncbi:DUF2852 domain-containing protein [Jannaschia sp. LMIT008]|uniref:DUF2852 domain-containing protein n=1 Tax=Jannaschia maritima TaxID=3032585 RepID=UPI0028122CBC|nr:DUF2852 domain-containing protein [Jannaschia sp. LMIT008]
MMQTAPAFAGRTGNPFVRAEAWLDGHGRKAWITAMVAGFIAFWPIGLALVLYMTMTGKWAMGRSSRMQRRPMRRFGGTGNTAFDAYRDDTLRRLEDEQRAFEEFLQRLRDAKDKSEFDQFMDERSKRDVPDAEARADA